MNDFGIWVDQVYGLLGNSKFMRSVCLDGQYPNPKSYSSVKWVEPRINHSRKSRFRGNELILSHCKIQIASNNVHLYRLGEAAWGAFHEDHKLTELNFQPNLAGIVVVIQRKNIERQIQWFEEPESINKLSKGSRLFAERLGYLTFDNNSPLSLGLSFLLWVKSHQLPYVIAAPGYDTSKLALEKLYMYLELDFSVPIIPGPSLRQDHTPTFDTNHARQVLEVLNGQISKR